MTEQNPSSEIFVQPNTDTQLREFEQGLLQFLEQQNLPTQAILVPLRERVRIFNNLDAATELIQSHQIMKSWKKL